MVYIDNTTFDILDREYYKDSSQEDYDTSRTFECDDLIADTISILNKKHYFTEYCCQGHFTRYIHEEIEDSVEGLAYIAALSSIPYIGFKSCVHDIDTSGLTYWEKRYCSDRLATRCKMYNELGEMYTDNKEYFEELGEEYKISIALKSEYWDIHVGKGGWVDAYKKLLKYHKELYDWARKLRKYE